MNSLNIQYDRKNIFKDNYRSAKTHAVEASSLLDGHVFLEKLVLRKLHFNRDKIPFISL